MCVCVTVCACLRVRENLLAEEQENGASVETLKECVYEREREKIRVCVHVYVCMCVCVYVCMCVRECVCVYA